MTSIGGSAFDGCTSLTEVNFNATNCTSMGDNYAPVFKYNSSITTLNIGDNVQNIPSYAFSYCSGLTNVIIGNSVTSIGDYAFYKCTGLTSVTIGNSVTSIGRDAFFECRGLKSVHITDLSAWCNIEAHSSPLIYAEHLYLNGEEIKDRVVIPDGTKRIGAYAFSGCRSLTSATIPNSVTSIEENAFYYCTGLTSVTIPNSVTSIGGAAFSGCTSLTSVTIPSSVTRIGYDAFSGCTGLTSITIPNSVTRIEGSTFYNCTGLTSVTIPNSVTNIGSSTFYRCSGLTNITIPSSVTSIGDYAFQNCSGLSSITSLNPVPPVCNSKTFKDVDMTIPLYVPIGSVLKYKAADVWRNFVIIREIGQDDIYLTINDGAHGSVKLKVDETNPYVTLKIEAENGWQVHSVTLNGENVKGEVAADGSYTTPAINANSTLGIVYAQVGTSARTLSASRLALTAHDGSMLITGTNGSEQVSVYTLDGKCVESLTATAGQTKVFVASGQVYIVKVDDSTFKISM